MKKLMVVLSMLPLAWVLAVPTQAATGKKAATARKSSTVRTYYGDISDSMCGAKHMMPGSPKQCTLACVKEGAKYIFVSQGKILNITNQDFAGLGKYAGDHVALTGAVSADGKSITVSKLAPAKAGM